MKIYFIEVEITWRMEIYLQDVVYVGKRRLNITAVGWEREFWRGWNGADWAWDGVSGGSVLCILIPTTGPGSPTLAFQMCSN